MPSPVRRRATYADIEALPANMVGEILDGELVAHPRPMPRHGAAANAMGTSLTGPFQFGNGGPGGWIFMVEPELHLGEQVVVPDIAGWRRTRMTAMPETVGITLSPDWICEVISPTTASFDRTVKFRIYHRFEVAHLWYLDPGYRTLEVFTWSKPHWIPRANFADFEDVSAPPFDAITFPLGVLWPFDTPPEPAEPSSAA